MYLFNNIISVFIFDFVHNKLLKIIHKTIRFFFIIFYYLNIVLRKKTRKLHFQDHKI